jgi:hypothetical protein
MQGFKAPFVVLAGFMVVTLAVSDADAQRRGGGNWGDGGRHGGRSFDRGWSGGRSNWDGRGSFGRDGYRDGFRYGYSPYGNRSYGYGYGTGGGYGNFGNSYGYEQPSYVIQQQQPSIMRGQSSDNDASRAVNRPGTLGVTLFRDSNAVKILDVADGSPADRAGLQMGDLILVVNDADIQTHSDLVGEITRAARADGHLAIVFSRDGTEHDVDVMLDLQRGAIQRRDGEFDRSNSGAEVRGRIDTRRRDDFRGRDDFRDRDDFRGREEIRDRDDVRGRIDVRDRDANDDRRAPDRDEPSSRDRDRDDADRPSDGDAQVPAPDSDEPSSKADSVDAPSAESDAKPAPEDAKPAPSDEKPAPAPAPDSEDSKAGL